MSDSSEFGGTTNDLGIHPFPHRPTAAERLRVIYRTGDETGGESGVYRAPDQNNEAFMGLLPELEQKALRTSEGVLDKGQVWEEMEQS